METQQNTSQHRLKKRSGHQPYLHLFRGLLLVMVLMGLYHPAKATDDKPKENPNSAQPPKPMPRVEAKQSLRINQQTIAELDQALAQLNQKLALDQLSETATNSPAAFVSAAAAADIDSAQNVFAQLDKENRYAKEIGYGVLVQLPFGIHNKVGNGTVDIAFSKVTFTPQYAEVTAYVRMLFKKTNAGGGPKEQEIFFGATGIKLSKDGGVIGETNLVLLGDLTIPFGNFTLRLKGGFDKNTGASKSITYVTLDCNGFKEVSINALLEFPRSMLIPLSASGEPQSNGTVTGEIRTVARGFDDLLVNLSLPPFAVNGFTSFGFVLDNAVFDLSDYRNMSGMTFPSQDYLQRTIPAGNESAWRGVYIREFRMWLPQEFRVKNSGGRSSLTAQHLLVDKNGVSVRVAAEGIYSLEEGDASGWAMSLESFGVEFQENQLVGGGFKGKIRLPISKHPEDALQYQATINRNADFQLLVSAPSSGMRFDVFQGTATLAPNSYIELKSVNGAFKPKAVLHGKMTIIASRAISNDSLAKLPGITFRGFTIQTEEPYLQADYFGYDGSASVAKFPVTVKNIGVGFNNDIAALHFTVGINLMETGFGGEATVSVKGKRQPSGEWDADGVSMTGISINGTMGNFKLTGSVILYDNDPDYGNGFGGAISLASTSPQFTVEAEAKFGNKPQDGYRYWYVSGVSTFSPGIPIAGPLQISGISAGVFHNMRPQNLATAAKTVYIPDKTISLGFKAYVNLSLQNSTAFKGEAGFEMVFNKNGGINNLGFFGEGELVASQQSILGYVMTKPILKANYDKMISKVNSNSFTKTLTQQDLLAKANKEIKDSTGVNAQGRVAFRFGLLMDFENKTLHGDAEIFANLANVVTGVGNNYRAGWLVMHFDTTKWYIHAGNPTDRMGIRMGIGSLKVSTGAYLMVGYDLPAMPDPPAYLVNMIGRDRINTVRNQRDTNQSSLSLGQGFAFGADVSINTGDFQFAIFYASFDAGLGFDVMLSKGNHNCGGMNGWYAKGQAYAYVQGSIGIIIKIAFVKKKFAIFSGGAGVLLQAGLPNPSWFNGYVTGNYAILGGAIRGSFTVKVSIGNECQ